MKVVSDVAKANMVSGMMRLDVMMALRNDWLLYL